MILNKCRKVSNNRLYLNRTLQVVDALMLVFMTSCHGAVIFSRDQDMS